MSAISTLREMGRYIPAEQSAAYATALSQLHQAGFDAVDVAIWLTGLGEIPLDSAWPDEMRPKLHAALGELGAHVIENGAGETVGYVR